jgi:hypothetical protein
MRERARGNLRADRGIEIERVMSENSAYGYAA